MPYNHTKQDYENIERIEIELLNRIEDLNARIKKLENMERITI